jgi:hypothetical protein
MILQTDGTALTLQDGESTLTAEYAAGDSRTGVLKLHLDDRTTTLRLDPWSPESYELYDCRSPKCLVLGGAERLVVLDRETLDFRASLWFEYEETETIDQPWFAESADGQFLVIATDRRVWCLDQRAAIRWCWSVRTRPETYFIEAAPLVDEQIIRVPVRSFRDERTIGLEIHDGQEHAT